MLKSQFVPSSRSEICAVFEIFTALTPTVWLLLLVCCIPWEQGLCICEGTLEVSVLYAVWSEVQHVRLSVLQEVCWLRTFYRCGFCDQHIL